ncbi:hypothetical protein CHISP_1387 [Chitinispirillum alkaliphilum]|nr:hypothetical protein CHISP_1387 [Chitinispirillum alkaliphilum]
MLITPCEGLGLNHHGHHCKRISSIFEMDDTHLLLTRVCYEIVIGN